MRDVGYNDFFLPLSKSNAMQKLPTQPSQKALDGFNSAHQRSWALPLTAVGMFSSVVYPHAPLVAFGVTAGCTLQTQFALQVAGAVWLTNQLYGFILRGYPLTLESFTWGAAMGLGTALVTVFALLMTHIRLALLRHRGVKVVISTLAGFVVFEGVILSFGWWLTGAHVFTWNVLGRLLIKEGVWALGLILAYYIFDWLYSKVISRRNRERLLEIKKVQAIKK